ncbi:MAG: hypothetical protein AAGI23_16450 [Bacteroidota bacterium]
MDTLLQSWGSGLEFWLLSMYKDPTNPRNIMVTKNIDKFKDKMTFTDQFLYEWQNIRYQDLPKHYFPFRDSTFFVVKENLNR